MIEHRENKLAAPVAAFLRAQGMEVWAEVPHHARHFDLVGRRDDLLVAVELKMGWTPDLLAQCTAARCAVQLVYGATPARATDAIKAPYEKLGMGMLQVVGDSVKQLLAPRDLNRWRAEYGRRIRVHLDRMTPGHEAAGRPSEKGKGPAKSCWASVLDYKAAHPAATWDELYAAIPNHYANASSMAAAMRMLLIRERKWDGTFDWKSLVKRGSACGGPVLRSGGNVPRDGEGGDQPGTAAASDGSEPLEAGDRDPQVQPPMG